MISPSQCRAARALLDWSQQKLAKESGVGNVTVRQLEGGIHEPRRATIQVVLQAFESAGVEFIEENGVGVGVRLRTPNEAKPK
jgi:transcriptional regulator with XRE-family HTH domain